MATEERVLCFERKLLEELDIPQPPGALATNVDEAVRGANAIGYPVLVRPSYVLGGRAMVIAYDDASVIRYMKEAVEYYQERPVLNVYSRIVSSR